METIMEMFGINLAVITAMNEQVSTVSWPITGLGNKCMTRIRIFQVRNSPTK